MNRVRWSFVYVASYLLGSGLSLLLAPSFALKLLFSNGSYGEVMPRMAGALCIGLGVLVVQMIRLKIDALYPTTVFIRFFFIAVWVWLYASSGDPFFLSVAAVVGFGVLLTGASLLFERRAGAVANN
jgi:hypothetical protein